jgi:hypothetical protein
MTSDIDQTLIPHSFIELFLPAGAIKPRESREVVAGRYDFCEDLAQMLAEQARSKRWKLGVTEHDVLERIRRGLLVDDSIVTAAETGWIINRLAELLNWPQPAPADSAGPG